MAPVVSGTAPLIPLRNPTASGRAYPAEVVAGVRALVEDEGLSFRAAAARSGMREGLVGEWSRRLGWRRGGVSEARGGSRLPSPLRGGPSRREAPPGVGVEQQAPRASYSAPPPPGSASPSPPSPQGGGMGRYSTPYGAAMHETARVRVEGSRDGLERIANELGVSRPTLWRWAKSFGWVRAAPPDRPDPAGPAFYRSPRFGRGYGGDAVGIARDLVLASRLPVDRIAAQAGVSRATLYRWMKRRGWERDPAVKTVGRTGPAYGAAVMAAARDLYTVTELSTRMIAARAKTTPERVAFWAKRDGWTRPRDKEDPYGRVRRRRRRRA